MTSALIHARNGVIIDEEVQTNTAEYVEAVKTRDKEKECGEIRWTILILRKACAEISRTSCDRRALVCSMNEVTPLPCLTAKEGQSSKDRPKHPFLNGHAIHTMTSFYS